MLVLSGLLLSVQLRTYKPVIQQQHRECTTLDVSDIQTFEILYTYVQSFSLFDLFSIKIDTVVLIPTHPATLETNSLLQTTHVWPEPI